MKYLILILLTFNVYADVKIEIENSVTGKKYGAKFETQPEADMWKADNIANDSWGKKDRWIKKDISGTCPADERTVDDGFGNFHNECFYPVEYVITETDITAEVAAKKAKKDADNLSLEAIKTRLTDGSAKLEDIIEYIKIKEGI